MTIEWIPEKFAPSGGLAATGFYNLLGRPRLDPLAVLIRETAQNSWDARDETKDSVLFNIQGGLLSSTQAEAIKYRVLRDFELVEGSPLVDVLASDQLTALYIWDRNTLGLGGPVQANMVSEDKVYDWVDFVLNVGKANTQGNTGGTYGYGKTISYVVSLANTIVIHTRAKVNGVVESRLIACAIGKNFDAAGVLYTGRHWWGRSISGYPTPLVGEEADELAAQVGMPPFEDESLGTNLMILAPDFGSRTPVQGMRFIAESALWHLWPKLLAVGRAAPMVIRLSWNGERIDVPTPEDRPPLKGFADAYIKLVHGTSGMPAPVGYRHTVIERKTPRAMKVGDLATVPLVKVERRPVDDGWDPNEEEGLQPAASIVGDSHHVALLRAPELVVQYWEGPPSPESGTEWAGVFICRPELDAMFAKSEPPTHDAWSPELLTDRSEKNVVTKAMRDIRSAVNSRWGKAPQAVERVVGSTAVIADALGHLVLQAPGSGKGKRTPHGGGQQSGGSAGAKVELQSATPVIHEGEVATKAVLRVIPKKGSELTKVSLKAGVALDSSSMDTSLDPALRLVYARTPSKRIDLTGNPTSIRVRSTLNVEVEVLIARSRGTAVLLDVSAEAL